MKINLVNLILKYSQDYQGKAAFNKVNKNKRVCRQWDLNSPYIFILCAELLGSMIRKNNNITGISIDNKENKLSQYADDTKLF
jgi:hypothetical protein